MAGNGSVSAYLKFIPQTAESSYPGPDRNMLAVASTALRVKRQCIETGCQWASYDLQMCSTHFSDEQLKAIAHFPPNTVSHSTWSWHT
jgi:hypothetical protein